LPGQQSQATPLLTEARAQIQMARGDSAARLLARVLDPGTGASVAERVEALVLRGILEFFQGQESATAASFRDALTLNPTLQAPLLASFDTALVTILEAQRRLVTASPDTVVRDCSTRCPSNVLHPRVQQYGDFEPFNPEGFALSHSLDHRTLVLRFVVSATGRVEGQSVDLTADLISSIHRRCFRLGGANLRPLGILRAVVHHIAGAQGSASELLSELGDFPDCRPAGDQRPEDFLVAFLEAFGGDDFSLAGQQRDPAHLPEVEAGRIAQAEPFFGRHFFRQPVDDQFRVGAERQSRICRGRAVDRGALNLPIRDQARGVIGGFRRLADRAETIIDRRRNRVRHFRHLVGFSVRVHAGISGEVVSIFFGISRLNSRRPARTHHSACAQFEVPSAGDRRLPPDSNRSTGSSRRTPITQISVPESSARTYRDDKDDQLNPIHQ